MKSICVLCGGPSSEHDVSLASATAILKNVDRRRYDVWVCYLKPDLYATLFNNYTEELPDLTIQSYQPFSEILKETPQDRVFLLAAMHGEFGEDGTLQKILEDEGLTYTGSDSTSSALAMDKEKAAKVVASIEGVHTIPTLKVTRDTWQQKLPSSYPVFLKPNRGGSSINVFICKNETEFKETVGRIYQEESAPDYLIQPYMTGTTEISCAYLEKGSGEEVLLPPIEIKPQYSDFFDYEAKYTPLASHEICPPEGISAEMSEKISQLAGKIHKALSCRTYSRSDFLVKGDDVYYLETNTAPGMTETSLVPQECATAGISFSELLDFIIEATS